MKRICTLAVLCVLWSGFCAGAEGGMRFVRHAVLLEPAGLDLSVRENIALRSSATEPVAKGVFRFFVPEAAAGSLRVVTRAPDGMVKQQSPVNTGEPGVYAVEMSITPGDTQLDLGYTLPFRNPGEFSGRTLQTDVPVRLIVPAGVTLEGEGLTLLGSEQKSGAGNYAVTTPEYRVMVRAASAPSSETPESTASGLPVTQILPRVYDNLYLILGLAFAALVLGFIRLYRMALPPASLPASVVSASRSTMRRELRQRPQLAQRRA